MPLPQILNMHLVLSIILRVSNKMERRGNRKKRQSQTPTKSAEFVKISVSVPFSLLSLFDEEAERRGYTRSEAIRQGIRHQIEVWTGRRL
jgi:hypothetical protein